MSNEDLSHNAGFIPAQLKNWFNNRRWVLTGVGMGGLGLVLAWDWITEVGFAPILISILPCLVMCIFGLCFRCKEKSCSESESDKSTGQSV